MRPVHLLALLGSLCALYYFALGIAAGGHLRDRERAESPGERLLLTGFLWSLNQSKFLEEGQAICRKANLVVVIGTAAWITWAVLK